MNYTKLYDVENFYKYDNKYAIYLKNNITSKIIYKLDSSIIERLKSKYPDYKIYKSIKDESYTLIGINRLLIPIYGHFYNNADFLIAKYVTPNYDNDKFMLVKKYEVYCNEYNHPVLYATLNECKKKIIALKTNIENIKYSGKIDLSEYNINKYEKINPEEFI